MNGAHFDLLQTFAFKHSTVGFISFVISARAMGKKAHVASS